MRGNVLVWALALPSIVLGAKLKSSEKIAKFSALSKKNGGVIVLNSALYEEITDGPRDYSVSVVLTAMAPQFKCAPCQILEPEYDLVAKQWLRQPEHDQHFFAVLDFADGQAVYQKLGLQTAPTFQLFMPTEGRRASKNLGPETHDFARSGFKAEAIHAFLRGHADIPIKFSRPVDKAKLIATGATIGGVLVGGYLAMPILKIIFGRSHIWAIGTLAIILLMTSGYMWNQIRHPPYSQPAGNGRTSYIAGGYSNQYGAETHIVSVLYGILAFAAYTLAYLIPNINDPTRQRLGIYVWTGISVVMAGVLMNLFQMKQGGYPFRLF